MFHSSLPPSLSLISYSNSQISGSQQLLSIYLFVQPWCALTSVSELLTHTLMKEKVYQLEYNVYIQLLCLQSCCIYLFPKLLRSASFFPICKIMSYVYNIVRFFCQSECHLLISFLAYFIYFFNILLVNLSFV